MKIIIAAILVLMNSIAVAESPVADGPECIRAREEYARREALKRAALKKQKELRPVKQSKAMANDHQRRPAHRSAGDAGMGGEME